MRARSIIPPKDKQKPKIKQKVDKRPHLGRYVRNKWVQNIENEGEESEQIPEDFLLAKKKISAWTRHDIRRLINHHHEIIKFHKGVYTKLHDLGGIILSQLRRQNFRCFLTGIPFSGGLGFGNHGVGIDFIKHTNIISRHNIRLISAPFAMMRHLNSKTRHMRIVPQNPSVYKSSNIHHALAMYIGRKIAADNELRRSPITISFSNPHAPNATPAANMLICEGIHPFSVGEWDYDDYKKLKQLEKHTHHRKYGIAYIGLDGGHILINYFGLIKAEYQQVKLNLANPHIDIAEEIVKMIRLSFYNLYRGLID